MLDVNGPPAIETCIVLADSTACEAVVSITWPATPKIKTYRACCPSAHYHAGDGRHYPLFLWRRCCDSVGAGLPQ
eukprot:12290292-Alexandrium_andersonii.AAC.1